jgi:PST family polysaccharide transporter
MSSIKSKFLVSSIWVVAGRGLSNLSTFLIFALLARYLGPAEFGIVAFASVFVDIAQALAIAGITQALVQRPEWEERVASTAFWTNIGFALTLTCLMAFVVAPLVGWAFDERLTPLVAVLATTFVINAGRGAHEARLQREFRFRALATRTLIATIVGGVVGVLMAIQGFGAWSLVVSRIVSAVVQTVIVWTSVRWTPKAQFSRSEAKALLLFGIHLSGAAILGQLNGRTPELVIGWFIGPVGVGVYRVASRGINMLNDLVISPMQATTLAALSRLKDPEAKGRAYLRLVKACSIMSMPLYFGAAAVANDFVVICFGPAWQQSGIIMSLLASAGAAATIGYFSQPVLASVGRSDSALLTSFGTLVGNFVVALITVTFGLFWVAFGVSARSYLTTPLGLVLIKRATGVRVSEVLLGIAPSVLSATAMAAVLFGVKALFLASMHPILRMGVMIPLGAAVYSLCMLVIGRQLLSEVGAELQPVFSRFGIKLKK